MNILGEKTVLRAIEPSDCQLLQDLVNDPETEYMLGGWSFPVSSQAQLGWIASLSNERNTLRCIVEALDDHIAVGMVVLSDIDYKNGNAEIHIKISGAGYRGKGYGYDAVRAIVRYAFDELRLKCIYARVSAHNEPSLRLFSKCGFEPEGILRKRIYKRGNYVDVHVLSVISDR